MPNLRPLRLPSPHKSCRDLLSTWRAILTAALAALVREDEDGSCQLRFQCGFPVVPIQDAVCPHQKIRILTGKFIPIPALRSGHTFANQEEVCVGDGLVVELCLPAGGGESFQGRGKSLQGRKSRIFAQIGKRQADMVNLVERVFRNSIIFKTLNDFLMGHGKTCSRSNYPCLWRVPKPPPCRWRGCRHWASRAASEPSWPAQTRRLKSMRRGRRFVESAEVWSR